MRKLIYSLFALSLLVSCDKDDDKVTTNTDKELLEMSVKTDGFVWYKKSDALLPKSSGSAHNYTYLKTRFNSVAATQLTEEGKVKEGAIFPEGSLIVKELRNDAASVARYAVLYKKPSHEYADAKGWVWGYQSRQQQ